MTTKQIQSCTTRMAEQDKVSAELFAQMMAEATATGLRANAMRKAAWALYRDVLGVSKRPLYGKEKAKHGC